MIELYYAVSSRKTGEEVLVDCGKFESVDDFFSFIEFRYGYTERDYSFVFSGANLC